MTTTTNSNGSNNTTRSIALNLKPLNALVKTLNTEAKELAKSDERGADWLVGSMILALANRSAFEVKNNAERMDAAAKIAKGIVGEYKDGLETAPEPVRREVDKQATIYTASLSRQASYQAIYNACAANWETLKGKPMPDQFRTQPSSARASTEQLDTFLAAL